jgi:hypothetical protein
MTHDLPRNDADNGEPVVPADQRNWGTGGRPEHPIRCAKAARLNRDSLDRF